MARKLKIGLAQRARAVPGMTRLSYRPPVRRYLANPPRAGRQQGYVSSDGCAGGPFLFLG